MTRHELKTWPEAFAELRQGSNDDIRQNDRHFQAGDTVHLREWDPAREEYTGSIEIRTIASVKQKPGLQHDYVFLRYSPAPVELTETVSPAEITLDALAVWHEERSKAAAQLLQNNLATAQAYSGQENLSHRWKSVAAANRAEASFHAGAAAALRQAAS